MKHSLYVGQKLTLFRIDDAMGLTHRYELEVRAVLDLPKAVGQRTRLAVVRQRGKRKDQFLDVPSGPDQGIMLDGWDCPFRADTEGSAVFHGNACYNLVGEPDVIRSWIQGRAVMPVPLAELALIIVWPKDADITTEGTLLYPDVQKKAVHRG